MSCSNSNMRHWFTFYGATGDGSEVCVRCRRLRKEVVAEQRARQVAKQKANRVLSAPKPEREGEG